MYHGQSGSGFATQNRATSESVVATPRGGEGNMRMRGHDVGHLSLLV